MIPVGNLGFVLLTVLIPAAPEVLVIVATPTTDCVDWIVSALNVYPAPTTPCKDLTSEMPKFVIATPTKPLATPLKVRGSNSLNCPSTS